MVFTPERRHQLLEWAERVDGVVIEDEYDAEFRYDREPVGPLRGLAPDRVVSIGTVSKSLAPALRPGWAVVPSHLIAEATRRSTSARSRFSWHGRRSEPRTIWGIAHSRPARARPRLAPCETFRPESSSAVLRSISGRSERRTG
jgi:hypothetical protein